MSTTPEQPVPPILPIQKETRGNPTPPLLPKKTSGSVLKRAFVLISRCLIGILALLVIASLLGHIAHRMRLSDQSDKTKIIATLSSLKYPDDIELAKKLCTDQGAVVLQSMVSNGGFLPASFDVADIKTSGQVCDVGMYSDLADGESKIYVRLVNQNGWKFHDVYFAVKNGRKIGIWFSFAEQHPFITSAQMAQIYAPEIKDAVKDTTASFKSIVHGFKEMGDLFQDKSTTENTPDVAPTDEAAQQNNLQHFEEDMNNGDDAN